MPIRMVERPAADKWVIRIDDGVQQVLYEADSDDAALEYVLQITDGLEDWRAHGMDEFVSDGEPPQRTITLYPPIPLPEPSVMTIGRRRDDQRMCPTALGIRERYIPDPLERQAERERMERILEEEDELAIIRMVRRRDQRRAAGNLDAA